MQNYQEWKNWCLVNFASALVEENLYFSKLKKKFKLGDGLDVLEIGFGNGSSPFGLSNQYGDITHQSVITESKIAYWAKCINLEINYKGGDIYLIYNGKKIKIPIRILKRALQLLIERVVRWILSPQSKGFLSANSLHELSLKNNES